MTGGDGWGRGRVAVVNGRARAARLAVVALIIGLLLFGSLWGDDDDFPFGPFRMYASTESLNGTTSWFVLREVGGDGRRELPYSAFGLRRAELEGRIAQLAADPSLLGELATTYERRNPAAAPLSELEVVERRQAMRDGAPVGDPTEVVVVAWRRP